jgi:hypothetical protein
LLVPDDPRLYAVRTPRDDPESNPTRPSVAEGIEVDLAIHTDVIASIVEEILGMPKWGADMADENNRKRPRISSVER